MDDFQNIPIPTPTPRPIGTPNPEYSVEIEVDLTGFDKTWASEAIQAWQMIPLELREGSQATSLFLIFAFAFALVMKTLRREKRNTD